MAGQYQGIIKDNAIAVSTIGVNSNKSGTNLFS